MKPLVTLSSGTLTLQLVRKLLILLLFSAGWSAINHKCMGTERNLHPISVTETSVFVTRTKAIVRIQLFAEDLMLFQGLEPDDMDVVSAEDLRRGLEQHKAFLLEKVTLRNADGEAHAGSLTGLTPFEIPAEGIPVSDLMLHSATYEFEFPFAAPPEFLTLQQNISDENFIFPSDMKLSVHQSGSDLTFTDSLRAGSSVTLRFDWDSKPLSDDATDEDWEKWFEKQREETLGITSYSSVYSFIYIEPAEVRHEILIPLATLKTFLAVQHKDPAFLEVDEQPAVRELIQAWLKDANPVTINGTIVAPEFTRIDFYGVNLKDFATQAKSSRVSVASGRAGIILTYRTLDDSVRETTLIWDKFQAQIRKVESVVLTADEKFRKFEFSRFNKPEDNVLTWTCPEDKLPVRVSAVPVEVSPKPTLTLPLASLGLAAIGLLLLIAKRSAVTRCAAAGLLVAAVCCLPVTPFVIAHPWKSPAELSTPQAEDVFRKLQSGTYRALDFGSENRIYESLATTVDGKLLEELYLQLRSSLEIREQGGAVARVRSVEFGPAEQLARKPGSPEWPGFQLRSQWTVSGTVEHWGHVHERRNQFEAVFSIEPRDGHWKITAMDVQNQTQLSQKTSVRKT